MTFRPASTDTQHAHVALERVRERDEACTVSVRPPRIQGGVHPRRTTPPSQSLVGLFFNHDSSHGGIHPCVRPGKSLQFFKGKDGRVGPTLCQKIHDTD